MTMGFRMKGWAFYVLTCARSLVRCLGLVLGLLFATCSQKLEDAELFFWIWSIYVVGVLFECPKQENILTSGNSGEGQKGVFIYSIKRSSLVEQGVISCRLSPDSPGLCVNIDRLIYSCFPQKFLTKLCCRKSHNQRKSLNALLTITEGHWSLSGESWMSLSMFRFIISSSGSAPLTDLRGVTVTARQPICIIWPASELNWGCIPFS